jgi:DNA-binding XRE family transcriptional regulator
MKNAIQNLMNEKGLTRIELSAYLQKRKLAVSRQAVHAYCHNKSQPLSGEVRRAICEFLKEKITNVFIYDSEPARTEGNIGS